MGCHDPDDVPISERTFLGGMIPELSPQALRD